MKTCFLTLTLSLSIFVAGCGDGIVAEPSVESVQSDLRCSGGVCQPSLLPGAHDCVAGYTPAFNEVAIFTSTNFGGYCQAAPMLDSYPDLGLFSWWNPLPTAPNAFFIKSMKVGGAAHGKVCSGYNFSGTCESNGFGLYPDISATPWRSFQINVI